MKKSGIVIVAVLVCLIGLYIAYPFGTWRYKITVNVETPEGLKTGYAVREVSAGREPKILPEVGGGSASVHGEAVVVDLGKRGALFAVMATNDEYVVFRAFPFERGGLTRAGIWHYMFLKAGPKPLDRSLYPRLVRFRDIKDPKTVELVDPDNFAKTYGQGVRLKDITIEMTDEKVTWGIEKFLPWLPARKNVPGALGGTPDKPFDDPTGLYLTGIEFSKERFW